jgi:vacuolar-type H+-ATPase subunit I/STV1
MKNNVVEINNLIKEVRNSKYNKKANVYDYFGNLKNKKSLPLYYSDTQKLCFPEDYYSAKEIEEVKKLLEDAIKRYGYNLKVVVTNNYYIGGLHSYGWRIKFE